MKVSGGLSITDEEILFRRMTAFECIFAILGILLVVLLLLLPMGAAALAVYEFRINPGIASAMRCALGIAFSGCVYWGVFREIRRHGREYAGGLITLFCLGGRLALRRTRTSERPVLSFERRLSFGRVWVEKVMPFDRSTPVHLYRNQRWWGEFPFMSIAVGDRGLPTPPVTSHRSQRDPNAEVTAISEKLRAWREELGGTNESELRRIRSLNLSPAGKTRAGAAAAISPDCRMIAIADWGGSVHVHDLAEGNRIALLRAHGQHQNHVVSLAFSPDGKSIAGLEWEGTFNLWDARSGESLAMTKGRSFIAHNTRHGLSVIAFSSQGDLLALSDLSNTVRLWAPSNAATPVTLEGTHGSVTSIAFSPDGRTLATGGKAVELWDVPDRTISTVLQDHRVKIAAIAFSPNGDVLATAAPDAKVRLLRLPRGEPIGLLDGSSATWAGQPLAFSPDGKLLAATGGWGGEVRLWECASGKLLATGLGHHSHVLALAFAPDGRTLLSASHDGYVVSWDLEPR